jgi:hypothetical protein
MDVGDPGKHCIDWLIITATLVLIVMVIATYTP